MTRIYELEYVWLWKNEFYWSPRYSIFDADFKSDNNFLTGSLLISPAAFKVHKILVRFGLFIFQALITWQAAQLRMNR